MKLRSGTFALASMLSTSILLTGCFGGSGGGSSSPKTVSFQFLDGSVSNFVYARNGSVAHQKFLKNLNNFFVSTAYASVDQSISCTVPEPVSFEMDILTATGVAIETTCSTDLQAKLRAGMLKAMANKTLRLEYAGGSYQWDAAIPREIAFRSEANFFGKYDNIFANGRNILCRDYFTFGENGKVFTSLDEAATSAAAAQWITDNGDLSAVPGDYDYSSNSSFADADEVIADCYDGDESQYAANMNFRFKDGYLEIDPDGSDFSDSLVETTDHPSLKKLLDYNRLCIPNGTNDGCDLNGIAEKELPRICFEGDTAPECLAHFPEDD